MLVIFEPEEGKLCDPTQGSLVSRSGQVFKALNGQRLQMLSEPEAEVVYLWD